MSSKIRSVDSFHEEEPAVTRKRVEWTEGLTGKGSAGQVAGKGAKGGREDGCRYR